MIFADKLTDLRKKSGWSQEDLADRLEVSRQSVSKWESAQSVPDMVRILKLSELFGVSTDYLLKDELGPESLRAESHPVPDTEPLLRQVSMEEASAFLDYRALAARRISVGVMLCILSPVLLILVSGLSGELFHLHSFPPEGAALGYLPILLLPLLGCGLLYLAFPLRRGRAFSPLCLVGAVLLFALEAVLSPFYGLLQWTFHLTDAQELGVGLTVLILMVGGAVALFVITGLRGSRFEYLEKEAFETSYGVSGMVKDRQEKYRAVFNRHMTLGILLCVLSVLPIFLVLLFYGEADSRLGAIPQICAVAMLLALVAAGVLLIVHASMIWGSYQILLEEGEYQRAAKEEKRRNQLLSTVYWSAVTAGYLTWSFLSSAWDKTWIVWPIAGVCFGLVLAVARAIRSRK